MIKGVSCPHLVEAVTVGLTCVEQRLESKSSVRDAILRCVEEHYICADQAARPEDIPVSTLERLHNMFGFDFEAHGGKLVVCLPV